MLFGKRILVFIPTYNCEDHISDVLAQLRAHTIETVVDSVLVVNNCSTDETESVILREIETRPDCPIILLRNNHNFGLGGSHKVAFDYAVRNGFDYLIVLHGDNQASIQDIVPQLQNFVCMDLGDCLLGARFHKNSKLVGYSKLRMIGNYFFNWLFGAVTGFRIYDLGSGLNCYKVKTLNANYYCKFPDDLTFNYCMILAHAHYNHKISFFPIVWTEEGQVSNVKLFSQAKRVLAILFEFWINNDVIVTKDYRRNTCPDYKAQVIRSGGEMPRC